MNPWWYVPITLGAILFIVLATAFVCFRLTFYAPKRKPTKEDTIEIPEGEIYEEYRDVIENWIRSLRATPYEAVSIKSFDGLTLRGKYYEYEPGAVTEILFHGYKGNAERDLCGGVERCFALGRNALIVDQRASGESDGHVITFGIKECRDCLSWVDFATKKFGKDVKIILTGISMGAATVLMASGEELPSNVVCTLADCGYSSPRAIIRKVMKQMKLPVDLFYPFIKLGARIFGGFSLESNSPIEAMKRCKVPVIFVHGDNDDFVPYEMSKEMYEACAAPKKLLTVKGAGHGLAFPADKEGYIAALKEINRDWNINAPRNAEL